MDLGLSLSLRLGSGVSAVMVMAGANELSDTEVSPNILVDTEITPNELTDTET